MNTETTELDNSKPAASREEIVGNTEFSDAPSTPNVLERIENNIYTCNNPAQNQKVDLDSLQDLDKECEIQVAKWNQRMASYILGSVFSCVAGLIFAGIGNDEQITWMVYIGFTLLIPVIPFGFFAYQAWTKKKSFERYEYPDYRYLTCLRLLELLSADVESDSPLNTKLLLRPNPILAPPKPAPILPPVLQTDNNPELPPILNKNENDLPPVLDNSTSNMIPSSNSGVRGNVNWMSQNTIDQWLHMRGRFKGGTKFDFSLSENSEDYGEHFRYTTVRGKTKTKLKARKRLQWIIALTIRFKEKRYSNDKSEKDRLSQLIQLPLGAKMKKLDIRNNEFRITIASEIQKLKIKFKGSTDIYGAWTSLQPSNEDWKPITKLAAISFLNIYQILNGNKKTKPAI